MHKKLYFDHNATTACDKAVIDAMLPYFNEDFGNPSSSHHSYGWIAKDAIDESTENIAKTLGISANDIIYTSGSTEGINMVLKSFCRKFKPKGNHIISCKTEHKAVLDTCKFLEENEGVSVTYLDVDSVGRVKLDQLKEAIRPETVLVAIMHSNNETGVIQPLRDISKIIADQGILLFSDATQSLGKVDLRDLFETVDFACFSAHKLYGPKGIGMVYYKDAAKSTVLQSLIQGGGQQKGLRGGTINTPAIVGLAKAIELSCKNLEAESNRLNSLRNQLEEGLLEIDMSFSNSKTEMRLPNTINISFAYVDGLNLLRSLSKHMAVSNGSACNSASVEPSHVLVAMGVEPGLAMSSLRFGLGRYTQQEDIEKAVKIVHQEVSLQRENNLLWQRRPL